MIRGLRGTMPTREGVADVIARFKAGESVRSITRRHIDGMSAYKTRDIIADFTSGNLRWDPVDDKVAILRALQGDRKVFQSLTYFEKDTFLAILDAWSRGVNAWDLIDALPPRFDPGWFRSLSRSLGLEEDTLTALLARSRKQNAAA